MTSPPFEQINFSGLLSLPDGGIVLSYGLVVVFGVANGLLAKKAKLSWIRNQSFAIAAIFLACVTSYIFHAINAPQNWIQVEHYFVAGLGTAAAITLFPWSASEFIQKEKADRQKAALLTALDDTSNFPRILLQWHSTEHMSILYRNKAAVEFFVDNNLAQAHQVVVGANWYGLLDSKPEWRKKDEEIAKGKPYRNQVEVWIRDGEKNVVYVWHAAPVKGEGLPPLTWGVEFFNAYILYGKIEDLEKQVASLTAQNKVLAEELDIATHDSYKDIANSLDELNKIIEPE